MTLLHNYLTVTVRNLARHKLYSFINIAGLAVGLACAILIVLFVRDELSYDKWIPDSANVYRAELTFHLPGRAPWHLAQAPFPLLHAMQDQIPEVKATTHLVPEQMTVAVGHRQFLETVDVVDPNFFQVIRLPLVAGDPATTLTQPESIVISQSTARKFFGNADPLGKILTVQGTFCFSDTGCSATHPLTVTGVLRDLPHDTQFVADLILPNSSQADELPQGRKEHAWTSTDNSFDYVQLAGGANPQTVLAKLRPILDRSISRQQLNGAASRGSQLEEYSLTQLWNAHLTSDQYGGMTPPGSWSTVYGFSIIAILILLVACFNFTNLATARAALRAREIGLRKTAGARRRQLIAQFLSEAILTALISLIAALVLVEISLPGYERLLGRPLALHYVADWRLLAGAIATAIVAGLLSGAYPAVVLSRFRPAAALKSSTFGLSGSGFTRLSLVVLQFAVSIGLGISAIVVFRQVDYARHIDLGFDRGGVVVINGASLLKPAAQESFARALSANPAIVRVARSDIVPFDVGNASNIPVHLQGQPQTFTAHIADASPEFPSLYGMRLLAGRLLSSRHGEDQFSPADVHAGRSVLINAAAAHRFGYTPETALGKMIVGWGGRLRIVGVLGDAKIDGMKVPVLPTVYLYNPADITVFSVRIRGGRIADTLSFIDRTWRSFAPTAAIQRYFLSDAFDGLFKSDEKQGEIFGLFVAIAIFIACLGLFGLAAFTTERRTKEIGIRKVLGARIADIIRLLLWQFSIPVLVANAIAWPVAYCYLRHWLEAYAFRISLDPRYFLGAGAVALAIAWSTIFAHALRVARANPIHALRYE
jgi:putative ABC transport system permease protein